jgi:hypothetical protein
MKPVQGRCYSLRQILTVLELTDSPHLGVGEGFVVQDAHLTNEQMLSVVSTDDNDDNMFADTMWRYMFTTSEEIPVFEAVYPKHVERFLDIDGTWVTPKGFPRENPMPEDWDEVFISSDDEQMKLKRLQDQDLDPETELERYVLENDYKYEDYAHTLMCSYRAGGDCNCGVLNPEG